MANPLRMPHDGNGEEEDRRHSKLFISLGKQLNNATSVTEASRIITNIADQLFGWDACTFDLYSSDTDTVERILNVDTISGRRQEVAPRCISAEPTPRARRAVENGGELILRKPPFAMSEDSVPFGDISRPSASILFVPIHHDKKVVGFLSIQSYQMEAYRAADLDILKKYADLCGGALHRIRADETLRKSEQRYRSLVSATSQVAWTTTADGQVIEESLTWQRYTGQSWSEFRGWGWTNALHPEDSERSLELWKSSLAAKSIFQTEFRLRAADGTYRFCSIRGAPVLDANGSVLEWVVTGTDITERKLLENQYRQAQKMEAFGQLAGGVAHDFNNLLTVITGYTNLLLLNESLDADSREQLTEISSAGEKATNLTRQLLTLSQKREIKSEPLNLNDIAANIMKMLKRVIGEHLQLQFHCAASLPLIKADIGMMEQVLLNVAINGRDAMPNGGVLEICTSVESVGTQHLRHCPEARTGEFVCLSIRDNGCGMSPEVKARIFEPFFTTKGRKGTGLGLATVYSIIKQHKGWIDVITAPNAGTAFRIFLPVSNDPKECRNGNPPDPDARGGSETILLVEDEPALRALARQILKRHGYSVLEAESGVKALAVWQQHSQSIDLLLTDMVMPDGLNGHDLAKKLLAERPELKVIYSSGYSVALETFESQLREGWNFLPKPYNPNKLAKAVRHRLDDKPFAEELVPAN